MLGPLSRVQSQARDYSRLIQELHIDRRNGRLQRSADLLDKAQQTLCRKGLMRCRFCRCMWVINEMSEVCCCVGICRSQRDDVCVGVCGGLMRFRLCKYMLRINEMYAV